MTEQLTRADEPSTRIAGVELAHAAAAASETHRQNEQEWLGRAIKGLHNPNPLYRLDTAIHNMEVAEIYYAQADCLENWTVALHNNNPSQDFINEANQRIGEVNPIGVFMLDPNNLVGSLARIESSCVLAHKKNIDHCESTLEAMNGASGMVSPAAIGALNKLFEELEMAEAQAHCDYFNEHGTDDIEVIYQADESEDPKLTMYLSDEDLDLHRALSKPGLSVEELNQIARERLEKDLAKSLPIVALYEQIFEAIKSGQVSTHQREN